MFRKQKCTDYSPKHYLTTHSDFQIIQSYTCDTKCCFWEKQKKCLGPSNMQWLGSLKVQHEQYGEDGETRAIQRNFSQWL